MNKLSVLLLSATAITALSALLALPAQAQIDPDLLDILSRISETSRLIRGNDTPEREAQLEQNHREMERSLEKYNRNTGKIRGREQSESREADTNGGSRQNQNSPSLQSESNVFLSSFCDGYLKGAAITGNYSSVPDACGQYMRQPSSSQRSNRQDSDRYVEEQELRNRRIQRNADINLESIRDSNCLASSDGCVRIRLEN